MTQRVRGVVRRVRDFAGPGASVPEKSLVWAGKWNEARAVFFRKTKSLVGLDVGSSAVKAVELRQTMGGYRVVAGGTDCRFFVLAKDSQPRGHHILQCGGEYRAGREEHRFLCVDFWRRYGGRRTYGLLPICTRRNVQCGADGDR